MKARHKRGSAIVEASIVFPMVIFIIVSFISIGIKLSNYVKEKAEENDAFTQKIMQPDSSAENILRYSWMAKNMVQD